MYFHKKKESNEIDIASVEYIGIDDFAIKKRHKYATIMVNQSNHKIISAINSREISDIQKWLQQYPNLKVVSRDGSNIYKLAIELANPEIIQVSDRFHLIKGLSDAIREEIKIMLPRQITLDEITFNMTKRSLKERFEKTKKEVFAGEKVSTSCKANEIDTRIFKKLIAFNDNELKDYFTDAYTKKRQNVVDRKNNEIRLIRDLYAKEMSYIAISKKTGFDPRTIKKYIESDNLLTIEDTKRERYNSCTPYHDKICELLVDNEKIKTIYVVLQKLGYQGKYGMLKKYISNIKNEGKLIYKRVISRKPVIKLLFNSLEVNKELSRDTLATLYKKYPSLKNLIELMYEFKGILLVTKSEKALAVWFKKAAKLNLSYINSFTKGCYNDMTAINNSMRYQYSNGVVEASVNKIKLVKRIMHGRCSFDLLKSKTLRLEFLHSFN